MSTEALGEPITLSSGTWPAIQYFKSAGLFLDVDESEQDFTVSSHVLADWVVRWDRWYKEAAGILEGKRLHLVYHRELAIVGDLPLRQFEALIRIGQACRSVGIGFSVTVELAQACEQSSLLYELIKSGVVSSMGVRQIDLDRAPRHADAKRLVEALLDRGMQLGLIGPVLYWRELGLLGSGSLNKSNITVYPRSPRDLDALPFPLSPVQPCFSRFRVYIDTDGVMYPCLGMLGVDSASLGTVFDAFGDTRLGHQVGQLELTELARSGPDLSGYRVDRDSRRSALPTICEHHRMALLKDSETTAAKD